MVGTKEASKLTEQAKEPARNCLPHTRNRLDTLREQAGKGSAGTQEEKNASWGEPHRLMAQYLAGKLSAGQLAHKLRAHNSVQADTVIKNGKHDSTKTIEFREMPRASMGNPGGDLRPQGGNEEPSHAKYAKDAQADANKTDDERQKQECEKQQRKLEQSEQQQLAIVIANLFEQQAQDVKNSHQWREEQHRERLEEEEQILQECTPEEERQYLTRTAKRLSLASRIMLFVGKILGRADSEVEHDGAKQADR